jgi:hypothetical protein
LALNDGLAVTIPALESTERKTKRTMLSQPAHPAQAFVLFQSWWSISMPCDIFQQFEFITEAQAFHGWVYNQARR